MVNPVVVVLGRGQIQANRHIAPWPKTSGFNGFDQGFNGPLIGAKLRPKSTFVGHAQVLALLGQGLARSVVDLGHPFQGLGEAVGPIGNGQKILQIHAALGMGAATKNLNLRQGQAHFIAAGQITPQRQIRLAAGRPQTRQGHGRQAVAAQARLVGRAIQVAHRSVNASLVGDVHALQARGNHLVDRAHRHGHAQTFETRAAIAQLFGFTRAGRGTRRCNGAPHHATGQLDFCLNGGAAP